MPSRVAGQRSAPCPTTERSDWNWANDCSSSPRARVPADAGDQVDRHVVGRRERRPQRIGPPRGQPGDRARIQPGLPEHDGVTLDVDPAPTGPTGQLGELPRRDVGVRLAVVLDQLLQHHRPGRHVDAQGQGLGGEDDLDQPADERLLDALLERRQHPGVVGGDPAEQRLGEPFVVQRPQVGARTARPRAGAGSPRSRPVRRRWSADPGAEQLADRRVAADPGEDEDDRRQQPGARRARRPVGPARVLAGPATAGRAVRPLRRTSRCRS